MSDFIAEDFLTETCTYWKTSGVDEWTGVTTYSAPVAVKCWYKQDYKMIRNAQGQEVVSTATFFSPYLQSVSLGDLIHIGTTTEVDPLQVAVMPVIGVGHIPASAVGSSDLYKVFV